MSPSLTRPRSNIALRSALAILCVTGAGFAAASTFVVAPDGSDSGSGSVDSPLATINAASRRAHVGDTIYLRGGTYTWSQQQYVDVKPDGVNWVTFSSYPGETAIIDGSNMKPGLDMVHVGNSVKVQYLTFTHGQKSDLSLWNAHRIRVKYCRFTQAVGAGILVGSNTVNGADDVQIIGCKIYDCVQGNQGGKSSRWPPALQLYQATNVLVSGCLVSRNFGEGIGYSRTTSSEIRGNTVYDNYSVNVYLDNVWDTKVVDNFIYTTQDPTYFRNGRAASGISCASEKVVNPIGLARCTIENNIVTNCFTGFWYSDFGLGGGLKGFKLVNNTFYHSSGPLLWIDSDAGHSNNVVEKNIFQQGGTAPIVKGSTKGFHLEENCWIGGDPLSFYQASDVVAPPKFRNSRLLSREGFKLDPKSTLAGKKIGYGGKPAS